jgi:hypothetical protein
MARHSKFFFSALVIGFALLVSQLAKAEGGCPPGQYPQQGQGWQTCVPIPGGDSSNSAARAPPVHYSARWGAIATDGVKGILGSVDNAKDKATAEEGALEICRQKGGSPCKIGVSYANGCGSMSVGDKGFTFGMAPTQMEATAISMARCSADGDTACHPYQSGCSTPIRD